MNAALWLSPWLSMDPIGATNTAGKLPKHVLACGDAEGRCAQSTCEELHQECQRPRGSMTTALQGVILPTSDCRRLPAGCSYQPIPCWRVTADVTQSPHVC